jgi:hypothetical protein
LGYGVTITRDVTFPQPGYPIPSIPKTLSRQNNESKEESVIERFDRREKTKKLTEVRKQERKKNMKPQKKNKLISKNK